MSYLTAGHQSIPLPLSETLETWFPGVTDGVVFRNSMAGRPLVGLHSYIDHTMYKECMDEVV
ncbi:hypothetical protein EV130_104161 [Rhizobium azibense]|nr:hypothetical protein EV130_104161 [Rhizobium azibense]